MRFLRSLFVAVLIPHLAFGAFANGYTYRRSVTFDSSKVSGSTDLTDFAVLFCGTYAYLADSSNGGNVESSSGHDIRFELADTTKLDHEIQTTTGYINTTGAVCMWIRIPTLGATADTTIYMYYGKSGASAEQNPTGVWPTSDYGVVLHMEEDPTITAPEYKDSTSNGNSFSDQGGAINSTRIAGDLVAGKIGGAQHFTATLLDEFEILSKTNTSSLNETDASITLSCWIKPSSTVPNYDYIFAAPVNSGADPYVSYIIQRGSGVSNLDFIGAVSTGGAGTLTGATVSGGLTLNAWQLVTMTYDGSNVRAYVNTTTASASKTGNINSSTDVKFIGGAHYSNNNNYGGDIDECRLQHPARSADWIATRVNAEGTPSTFYAIGSEETSSAVARRRIIE